METLFKYLLAVHITGGGISLITGLYMMAAQKGDTRHKRVGRIYFWSLFTASLCAIPMCIIHPNLFLSIISIITLYMLITALRYLKIRRPEDIKATDYIFMTVMILAGVVFIVWGSLLVMQSGNFGIVLIVLGFFSINFGYQDFRTFRGKSKYENFWLVMHLQRMTGSYISSVTAFVVVNNTLLPGVVAWLLPAFIIAPLIVRWSRRFGLKSG